ncbi:MAG: hypothetical protein ACJ741_05925 [Pyrinomonadaceae bacterium]
MLLRATPLRLALSACLLLSLTVHTAASGGCKPTIDKKNVMIELQIEGFNNNRKMVFIVPVNTKKPVTGSGAGSLNSQPGHAPASFSYGVDIAEQRSNGAVVELSVVATTDAGAVRTLKRTVFVPYEEIVEQMYLGGVNMKAYFKMKPVTCHDIQAE